MVEFRKALIPSDSVGWCKFLRKRVDATPESLFWRPRAPKVKNLLRECPPKSTCGRQKAFAVSRRADICQTSALLFLARRGQRRRFRLPRRSLLSRAHAHTHTHWLPFSFSECATRPPIRDHSFISNSLARRSFLFAAISKDDDTMRELYFALYPVPESALILFPTPTKSTA
jgi:hypothetical protein